MAAAGVAVVRAAVVAAGTVLVGAAVVVAVAAVAVAGVVVAISSNVAAVVAVIVVIGVAAPGKICGVAAPCNCGPNSPDALNVRGAGDAAPNVTITLGLEAELLAPLTDWES